MKRKRCVLVFSNWHFNGSPDDSKGCIVLGTPFLTHAHSVFDLDRITISCESFLADPALSKQRRTNSHLVTVRSEP